MKTYQTAYAQVQKVQIGTVLPLQHWYELTRVAEEVHIKVGWLLLPCMYGGGVRGGSQRCKGIQGMDDVDEDSFLLKTWLQSTCTPFCPGLLPSAGDEIPSLPVASSI